MELGFTGTQAGMTKAQWDACWELFCDLGLTKLHHGLCVGADKQAHRLARHIGATVHGHPPLNTSKMAQCDCDELNPPKDYLLRNRDIVDASAALVATPKGPEELRSGTWSTVRYAKKCGKPVYIVMPDGTVHHQGDT